MSQRNEPKLACSECICCVNGIATTAVATKTSCMRNGRNTTVESVLVLASKYFFYMDQKQQYNLEWPYGDSLMKIGEIRTLEVYPDLHLS